MAQQVAPGASANNTMATLALVAGILSFLCLGPLGAILAIIFGFLGTSKATEIGGNGRGMAKAGIILGAVNIVISVIAVILIVVLAGRASDSLNEAFENIGGTAPASSYEVTIQKCSENSFGDVVFEGTIRNLTSSSKSFVIQTEVIDAGGEDILTVPAIVTDIPAGATRPWDANAFGMPMGSIDCVVTGVNNFFN